MPRGKRITGPIPPVGTVQNEDQGRFFVAMVVKLATPMLKLLYVGAKDADSCKAWIADNAKKQQVAHGSHFVIGELIAKQKVEFVTEVVLTEVEELDLPDEEGDPEPTSEPEPVKMAVSPVVAPAPLPTAPAAAAPVAPPPPPPQKGWRGVASTTGQTYVVGPDGSAQWEPPGAALPPPPPAPKPFVPPVPQMPRDFDYDGPPRPPAPPAAPVPVPPAPPVQAAPPARPSVPPPPPPPPAGGQAPRKLGML